MQQTVDNVKWLLYILGCPKQSDALAPWVLTGTRISQLKQGLRRGWLNRKEVTLSVSQGCQKPLSSSSERKYGSRQSLIQQETHRERSQMRLIPKKWTDFQHYKDRAPPWIKLHRDILNNRDFMCLPLASKALAPLLWLLASESKDGSFDASTEELSFRLRVTTEEVASGLAPLISKGFFLDASTMLAPCLQPAIPETEREREGETKKRESQKQASPDGFAEFYTAYPKKVGRPAAEKAYKSAKVNDLELLLKDIEGRLTSGEWSLDKRQFIPNPATYLNQRRWEDEDGEEPVNPAFAGML